MTDEPPEYIGALLRHFADLRDGTHGDAARSRHDKERLFAAAVPLLDPYARQVLDEVNTDLLLGTGEVAATGVRREGEGIDAVWTLSWPEQRAADIDPITIRAWYGAAFHHPHLRGATVGEWPLNVFTPGQATGLVPTLRSIVAADLHNLVFQRDYRIVPATVGGQPA